jgi:putative glutamine amidotransferase
VSPLIGITSGDDYSEDLFFLRNYYVKAVEGVGGVPFIIPTVERQFARTTYVSTLDGLILSGGGDVDPLSFGEEPQRGTGKISPLRDDFEIMLVKEFYRGGKPILAICRGIQVMNIALGGTIIQDINTGTINRLKHDQEAPKWHTTHLITVQEGTKLSSILPGNKWSVNSFHHQAVERLAPGFVVSAYASDGIIEAVESVEHPFALGVQWHPECNWSVDLGSYRIFNSFARACREISIHKNI